MAPLHAFLTLILLCSSAKGTSVEQALLDWVAARGGEAHLTVRRRCPHCPREPVAARSFAAGEVVARVPANASVLLEGDTAAEQAWSLLERLQSDPAFNATFAPYLAALPPVLLSPEAFSDNDLAELQMPELARLMREKRERLEQVLADQGPPRPGLARGQLQYWAAAIRTRNFFLLGAQRLVPVFDLLNHSEQPNTQYQDDDSGEFVVLLASRPIAEGEVLTDSYKVGVLHRPDAALFHYAFLPEHEQALLCVVDLPTYNPSKPWARTMAEDDSYLYLSGRTWVGAWLRRQEHARLAGLLAEMPTSEAEDQALLAGGQALSVQRQLAVQFRLRRKQALRRALERLELTCGPSSLHSAARADNGSADAGQGSSTGLLGGHSLQQCASAMGGWRELPQMLAEAADALALVNGMHLRLAVIFVLSVGTLLLRPRSDSPGAKAASPSGGKG